MSFDREEAIEIACITLAVIKRVCCSTGGIKELRLYYKHRIVARFGPAKRHFPALECDPAALESLIALGRKGDVDAHAVLGDIAADLITEGLPLPSSLREYIASFLRTTELASRRGRKPNAKLVRNLMIMDAIEKVAYFCDLDPTRNRATKRERESGCTIVVEALRRLGCPMKEAAVEKIYQKARQPSRSSEQNR